VRDPAARRLLAALLDRYSASLRDEAAAAALGGGSTGSFSAYGDDEDGPAAAEAATALCEALADASFGDALHGRAAALCLRARAPPASRTAALRALAERGAAHLLPPAAAFAFPAGVRANAADAMFFPAAPAAESDGSEGDELVTLWADFACSGRAFDRAAAEGALPAALAEHAVRRAGDALRAGGGGERRAVGIEALLRRVAEHGAEAPARIAKDALQAAGRAAV
jgi:hypothetical protein